MKLRTILLAVAALFAVGPVVTHADDGLRLVSITAARITTALGFVPLNPANNLSEVTPATARTNLGLGTAATQTIGTSGAMVGLLSTANIYATGSQFGATTAGYSQFGDGGGSNAGSLSFYTGSGVRTGFVGFSTSELGLYGAGTNPVSFYTNNGGTYLGGATVNGQALPKLSAVPTTAPGAGRAQLFLVTGTNVGSCKLEIMAGTSTTPVTIVDNVGAGC